MSIRLMTQVWDMTDVDVLDDSSCLLVMLKLADNANDEGVCWPSLETIGARCHLSKRQTIRVVNRLAKAGLISKVSGSGSRSTRYTVLPTKGGVAHDTPKTKGGVAHDTPGGDTHDTPGVSPMTPEPSVQPSIEPSVSADADSLPDNNSQQKDDAAPTYNYKHWHDTLCWIIYGNEDAKVDQRTIGHWVKECKALHDAGRTPVDLRKWFDQVWTQRWPGNTGERPTIGQVRQGLPAVDTLDDIFPPERKTTRVYKGAPDPEYYEPLP